jgi:hypothetical protein
VVLTELMSEEQHVDRRTAAQYSTAANQVTLALNQGASDPDPVSSRPRPTGGW